MTIFQNYTPFLQCRRACLSVIRQTWEKHNGVNEEKGIKRPRWSEGQLGKEKLLRIPDVFPVFNAREREESERKWEWVCVREREREKGRKRVENILWHLWGPKGRWLSGKTFSLFGGQKCAVGRSGGEIKLKNSKVAAVLKFSSFLMNRHLCFFFYIFFFPSRYLFQQDKFYDCSYDTGDMSVQCGRKASVFLPWVSGFFLKNSPNLP